jgi:TorA maturation chaperone TorD
MNEITEVLETRTNFYGFLSRMYIVEPARELADDVVNARFDFAQLTALDLNAELSEGFRLLKAFMERNKGRDTVALHEDLRDEYTLLFIGPHRLPIEPYEAWWVSGRRLGEPLVRVKEAYQNAGVAKSKEYPELEDYIGFELKFMQYLSAETIKAETQEEMKEYLKLQRGFMDDHLLKWVPAFCDAVYEYKLSAFFKGIAKLTKGFIMLDDAVLDDLLESVR